MQKRDSAPVAAAGPLRFYVVCFALGLVAFGFGLVLDQFTGYPEWVPSYTAADIIPVQVVFGLILVATGAVATGRTGFMTMWHATLWMLSGLVLSWVAWWIGVALAQQ